MNWWSNRSKHQWWVMSCFLISATNCCHPMHSPVTGLNQTPWPVLKVRGHWYYGTSLQPFGTGMSVTTKDCFGQMINEVQTQSVKVRVEIPKKWCCSGSRSEVAMRPHALCSVMCEVLSRVSFCLVTLQRDMLACVTHRKQKTLTRWSKTDDPVRIYFASMSGWLYVMHYV